MVFAPWLALHPADSSDFSESETGEEAERETQIPLKVSLIWQLVPERGAWCVARHLDEGAARTFRG